MPLANRLPRLPALTLAALLALALALRLLHLDAVRHHIDHAYPIWQALRTLDYGAFPLVGQATSVLIANPALTGYLYLPPLLLGRSPVAVYLSVIALNTLAVAFAWRVAGVLLRDWRLAALVAFLMTVNPWVIEYSRTTWVQSLLPFFVCAIAALIAPVLTGDSRRPARDTFAALALATAFSQTYLLAFFIVVPLGVLLIVHRRHVPWRAVVAGGALFALATWAFGLAVLTGSGGGLERLDDFARAPARLSPEALSHAVRLVTGEGYALARSGAHDPDAAIRATLEHAAHLVLTTALIAGVAGALHAVIRGTSRRTAGVFALVWFGVPVLAMSYTGNVIHPFYLLLTLPAGGLLVAWGAGYLLRGRLAVAFGVAFLLAWAGLMTLSLHRHAQHVQLTPTAEDLRALPLSDAIRLAQRLSAHLTEGQVVYGGLIEWIPNSLSGRLFPVISGYQTNALSIAPHSGGVSIAYAPPGRDLPNPPRYSQPTETLTFADGARVRLDVYPPGGPDLSAYADTPPIPSDAGLTLVSYQLRPRPAGDWLLLAIWRVETVTPDTGTRFYGSFLHVIDADGTRIVNAGGRAVSGLLWAHNDVFVERIRFHLPPDARPAAYLLGLHDLNSATDALFTLPTGETTTRIPLAPPSTVATSE